MTDELLCPAIEDAAAAVFLGVQPAPGQDVLVLTFGSQTDIRQHPGHPSEDPLRD